MVSRRSVRESNSTTKSGQIGANSSCSSSESISHRSLRIHARSGARTAPLGRVKPADESKPKPVSSDCIQIPNWTRSPKLRCPDLLPVGGIIITSPSQVSSILRSGLAWQNSKNSCLSMRNADPKCSVRALWSVCNATALMENPPNKKDWTC